MPPRRVICRASIARRSNASLAALADRFADVLPSAEIRALPLRE
jgi:hypothetical protein